MVVALRDVLDGEASKNRGEKTFIKEHAKTCKNTFHKTEQNN